MILRRLELKNFGHFEDCAFDFRRGLNLVIGPGESGKTTLAEAIPSVLFGPSGGGRFEPWDRDGRGWAAALVFEDAGRALRIERDFSTGQVTFDESDSGGRSLRHLKFKTSPEEKTAEGEAFRAELLRLFGCSDEETFRFGQLFEEGNSVPFSGEGGTEGAAAVLARIAGKNQPAAGCEDEIETVRNRLAELERLWFDTRKAIGEGGALKEEIAELSATIESDRHHLAQGLEYLAQLRRQSGDETEECLPAKEENRGAGPATDLDTRRRDLERELAKTGLPRRMPPDLPGVLVQADDIRQEMIAIQKEAAELRQQLLKRPAPNCRLAVLLTVLAAGVVAAAWWWLPERFAWALAAGSLATVVAWGSYLWRVGRERLERSRLKGPLQLLEDRREEAQARLNGLDEQFSRIGLSPSAVEIVRMQKNLDRHLRLLQELAEVERALGEGGVSELPPVAAEAAVPDSQVGAVPLDESELAAAEAELASLGERLKEREERLRALVCQQTEREKQRESLRCIEEEGEALRRRESQLAGRSPASSSTTENFSPADLKKLMDEVGQTLGTLTAGRYTEVRLDTGDSWTLRGGDGEWHSLRHFSRGTKESFWLALRLVLGRELAGDRRPPVILDDVLTAFDPSQQADAVKVLERLAGEQQVILLSREEVLRKRANRDRWHSILLVDEKPRKPPLPQERSDDDGQLHLL